MNASARQTEMIVTMHDEQMLRSFIIWEAIRFSRPVPTDNEIDMRIEMFKINRAGFSAI